MIAKIKKNDTVMVIAGEDAGKTGKVVSVNPAKHTATVEGVNIQKKHRKARSAQDTSRIEDILGPVNVSNLMLVCPVCGKAVRVGISTVKDENGKEKKVRICKKCGAAVEPKAEAKAAKKATKKAAKTTETAETTAEVKKAPRKTTRKAEATAEVKKAPRKKAAETTEAAE